jgi:RimJ/RimL family protein N-acetyltransferase
MRGIERPAPRRVETERLVIRPWEPSDAAAAGEAVDSSLDHLRAWLDWAWTGPDTLEEVAELFEEFEGWFEHGENFVYGVYASDGSRVIGGTGLHPLAPGVLEIGYWVRLDAVGQGLATEMAAAMTRIAFDHCGAERAELHIEPANAASVRVADKLGYEFHGVLHDWLGPIRPGAPRRDVGIHSLRRDTYPGSPAASAAVDAFDGAGLRVL